MCEVQQSPADVGRGYHLHSDGEGLSLSRGDQLGKRIGEWKIFYNTRHFHQALGYKTPMVVWSADSSKP
jgi:transposase InsO family protein